MLSHKSVEQLYANKMFLSRIRVNEVTSHSHKFDIISTIQQECFVYYVTMTVTST